MPMAIKITIATAGPTMCGAPIADATSLRIGYTRVPIGGLGVRNGSGTLRCLRPLIPSNRAGLYYRCEVSMILAIDIGGTKFSLAAFEGDRMVRRESRAT